MGIHFYRLPFELRIIIWDLVLGEHGDAPTMVPFRTTRPYLLEEEDDDDELFLHADDAEQFMSDEQFEQIRLRALHQVAAQNDNGDAGGPATPAPMTLPSNDVVTIANDEAGEGGSGQGMEGPNRQGATNDASIGDEDGINLDEEDDGIEEDYEDYEDYEGSLDTDLEEFEPGNPFGQERIWDDEVVIPVYLAHILLVDREARDFTLLWLKKHNIRLTRNTIRPGEITTGFVPTEDGRLPYTRKYDPERDHLYVDRRYWRRFCDRLQMGDMMARSEYGADDEDENDPVHDIGATIKNLALPAFTMYQSVGVVGNILEYLPNIRQIACIWGDLPPKEWQPTIAYETVQRGGKPKTEVTNVLLPRWDHAQISEQLSQEEQDRRRDDTDRIEAEREKEREERRARREKAEKEGKPDGDDDDDDYEDYEDDDDEEEEGTGPIVTMCVRDPSDETNTFYERGYLGNWMDEIYNELSFSELPDHCTDESDGSLTLPIVPCKGVVRRQG